MSFQVVLHRSQGTFDPARLWVHRCLLLTHRAEATPTQTHTAREPGHSSVYMQTYTRLGATPSFSHRTKSLKFMIWFLTSTFRAHARIKIWP